MENKYQEATNELYSLYKSKVHKSLNRFEVIKYDKCFETLQELIIKMEKIGLELNNTHFMDNECKLKELEIIERIFKE